MSDRGNVGWRLAEYFAFATVGFCGAAAYYEFAQPDPTSDSPSPPTRVEDQDRRQVFSPELEQLWAARRVAAEDEERDSLVQELETLQQPRSPVPQPDPVTCASWTLPGCWAYRNDPETLAARARCGQVAWELPSVLSLDADPVPQKWESMGILSAAEIERLRIANQDYVAQVRAELEADYEAVFQEAPPAGQPVDGLIRELASAPGRAEALTEVSRHLASPGKPRGDDGSALARVYRRLARMGDDYETKVAEVVGPRRAANLRSFASGWGGQRILGAGTCEERGDAEE